MAASERAAAQGAALAMDTAGFQSPTSAGGSDEAPASTVGSLLGPTQVKSPSYLKLARSVPAACNVDDADRAPRVAYVPIDAMSEPHDARLPHAEGTGYGV